MMKPPPKALSAAIFEAIATVSLVVSRECREIIPKMSP